MVWYISGFRHCIGTVVTCIVMTMCVSVTKV